MFVVLKEVVVFVGESLVELKRPVINEPNKRMLVPVDVTWTCPA